MFTNDFFHCLKNPDADTEWNDTLRKFNILPPKDKEPEITEDDIIKLVDATIKEKTSIGK